MNKTFDFEIDISKPVGQENSFSIWRGDNVTFNFVFKNKGEEFDISSANKLRVYAKRIYNSGVKIDESPLFSGDFTESLVTASFNSDETSGDSGVYLLTVMLLDSSDNVITAQGIHFCLMENGYSGIYQPAQNFRDEVLDAKDEAVSASESAQTSATNAAQSEENAENSAITSTNAAQSADTSASLASTSAISASASKDAANNYASSAQASAELAASLVVNATELGQIKLDKGVLHCLVEGDYSSDKGRFGGTLASELTFPLSIVWRGNINFNTANITYIVSVGGTAANSDIRITVSQFADNITRIYMGTTALVPSIQNSSIQEVLKDGINNFALIVTTEDSVTYSAKFYINGSLFAQSPAAITPTSFTNSAFFGFNRTVSGSIGTSNADYSNIAIFNFDISDASAPYTISDYASGVQIPGTLLNPSAKQKALLALGNFVFTNGSTKIIPDYSGNLTDASVSGSVVGDNDTKIARLTSLINSQVPTA